MTDHDRARLVQTLLGVYAYYGDRELSEVVIDIWLADLSGHDIAAIEHAFVRHRRDPQRGQWLPKTADILRLLQPDERELALVAWAAVLDQVRAVGSYGRPQLDAASRPALDAVGGWGSLCRAQDQELPHLQRRFCEAFGTFDARAKRDEWTLLDVGHDAVRLQ